MLQQHIAYVYFPHNRQYIAHVTMTDLHTPNVCTGPKRLKHKVGKPQDGQVFYEVLPHKMINPAKKGLYKLTSVHTFKLQDWARALVDSIQWSLSTYAIDKRERPKGKGQNHNKDSNGVYLYICSSSNPDNKAFEISADDSQSFPNGFSTITRVHPFSL